MRKIIKLTLLSVVTIASLTSCASILSGTSQPINIASTPKEAQCDLHRYESKTKDNVVIASVAQTPSQVTVKKTKYDITVKCNKDGYEEGSAILKSGNDGKVIGNILAGGGIGWAVDSAIGADNKYPDDVNVPLEKKE